MTRIGVPVPPVLRSARNLHVLLRASATVPRELEKQGASALGRVEKILGRRFGDASDPLLVAVRSGARESMPGMMDTVLNLGLNDQTVQGLIQRTHNPRFAYDSYRRFVQMYADVVLGVRASGKADTDPLVAILERKKKARDVRFDTELNATALKELVEELRGRSKASRQNFRKIPSTTMARRGPCSAHGTMTGWAYRDLYQYPITGERCQRASDGLRQPRGNCATGVAFTRDPAPAIKRFYGEFLVNAQGEDVVAGIRTPNRSRVKASDAQSFQPASAHLRAAREALQRDAGH